MLDLPPGTEQPVIAAAAKAGLALDGLGDFAHSSTRGGDGLVVGYATPSDSAWSGALAALCEVLPRVAG